METLDREKPRRGASLKFLDYRNYMNLENVSRLESESESLSSLEENVYLYLTKLLVWRHMGTSEILVTARSACVDLL